MSKEEKNSPEKKPNYSWILTAILTVIIGYALLNDWGNSEEKTGKPPAPNPSQETVPEGMATAKIVTTPVEEPQTKPPTIPTVTPKPTPPPPRKVEMGSMEPPEGFAAEYKAADSGIVLQWVAPGKFQMGSPPDEQHRRRWEDLHPVTLTEGYWLGRYEVTQKTWVELGMENHSYFKGPRNPVGKVSWNDALEFCKRLSDHVKAKQEIPEGYVFRLPSEAEWEYACRAGTQTASSFGDAMSSKQANFDGRSPLGKATKGINRKRPMPVGYYSPNAWGFYDMHGNMWEWCLDGWREFTDGQEVNPRPSRAEINPRYKVVKGGSWYVHGWECRSTARYALRPAVRYNTGIGLRVALGRKLPLSK